MIFCLSEADSAVLLTPPSPALTLPRGSTTRSTSSASLEGQLLSSLSEKASKTAESERTRWIAICR